MTVTSRASPLAFRLAETLWAEAKSCNLASISAASTAAVKIAVADSGTIFSRSPPVKLLSLKLPSLLFPKWRYSVIFPFSPLMIGNSASGEKPKSGSGKPTCLK